MFFALQANKKLASISFEYDKFAKLIEYYEKKNVTIFADCHKLRQFRCESSKLTLMPND